MPTTPLNTHIGQNLRRWRRLRDLTQESVGAYLGVSFQQVQKYENGTNALSCEKLVKLAEVFGCSIVDLCSDPSQAQPAPSDERMLMLQINRIASITVRAKLVDMVQSIADAMPRNENSVRRDS